MKDYKKIFDSELIHNPPKPPWIVFPDVDPMDMFWRMGLGEEHIEKLYIYFQYCGDENFNKYMRHYPEPEDWKGWYDD